MDHPILQHRAGPIENRLAGSSKTKPPRRLGGVGLLLRQPSRSVATPFPSAVSRSGAARSCCDIIARCDTSD
jgi:hypothetical protein